MQQHPRKLVLYSFRGGVQHVPLLFDNFLFPLYPVLVDGQVIRPVAQDQHAGVQKRLVRCGNAVEIVYGFVVRGHRVDVVPVQDTVPFQGLYHPLSRKIFRPLECHVLQEVRHSPLFVALFQQESRISDEVKTGLVPGSVVMPQVIGQSVGQLAHHHFRIPGQQFL